MLVLANGHLVGWLGITEEELQQQVRLAMLPGVPLGRAPDLKRKETYGRLIPLHRVCPSGIPEKERVRWLCCCTCEKGKLVAVLAQNLGKPGKTEGCGCVFKERAAENIRRIFSIPEVRARNAASCSARMVRWQAENKASVLARAQASVEKYFCHPTFKAAMREWYRSRRRARNLDPDTPLATHRKQIDNAIAKLQQHIMGVRDDFTCALCHIRGKGKLAVHHSIPIFMDPNRAGDPLVLATLCTDCHISIAHDGHWRRINAEIQGHLLAFATSQEQARPTPAVLIEETRVRLGILLRTREQNTTVSEAQVRGF